MCGILASYLMPKRIVRSLIQELSLRGRDGYGVYNFKQTTKETENVDNVFVDFKYSRLTLANSRAIPTTEVESGAGLNVANQQPFSNNMYVVIHNGIIANDKELIEKYNLKVKSKVDSAILPDLFTKLGVVNGLKEIKGSFAIACYDKLLNKLYVAKNFMPLVMYRHKTSFAFVSLKEMIPEYLREKTFEVEPYICYEIDLNKIEDNIIKHSLYTKERNKKVLVICSSGIDSTTTAYVYKHLGYEVSLLHFTYGQAAEEVELFAVKKIANHLKSKLIVYDAKPIFENFKSTSRLLNHAGSDKKTQMLDAESTLSYVPNRNAIFAMIAGALAEKEGCDTVSFGGQQMDSVYPDNNNTFVNAVDNLLKYSLNWNTNIKFASPLINLIKHEIVEMGLLIGVPYEYVCSCYYPKLLNNTIIPCGECGCCQFREYSFKMLQEVDIQFPNSILSSVNYKKIKDVDKFIKRYVYAFA